MSKKKNHKERLIDGLPVVDGNRKLILEITKKDVQNSKKKDSSNCAAAKAGQRQFKTDVKVFVSRTYIKVGKKWERYITPQSIGREIVSFDRGASFEPGIYNLVPSPPSSRLGSHREPSKETGKGTTIRARHVTSNIRLSQKEKQ